MKLSKATITVMVVSCKATKSGKGYMLSCLQDDVSFLVFSKKHVQPTVPGVTDITVDVNCFVDRQSGEFKEFISVAE